MIRYPRECRDQHPRLWPTAGVCEQRLSESLRLLPTAGVCEQRLGTSHRLLLTAGVCNQHLGMSSILLHKAGVCGQRLGVCPRHRRCKGICSLLSNEDWRKRKSGFLGTIGILRSSWICVSQSLCFCKSISESLLSLTVATFCYFCCEYYQLLLISILLTGDLQVNLTHLAKRPESRKAAPLVEG